jgi:hypothetical protein
VPRLVRLGQFVLFTLLVGASVCPCSSARADEEDRLYDFTDAYYQKNGVNPAAITSRRQPVAPFATHDIPFFSFQNTTRALLTLPAYNDSGSVEFFTVMGELSAPSFTNDAAGRKAKQTADTSPEYIFPRKGTDPLGLGAFRQSSVLDMRNGYFSNNPLGLWVHTFVAYTDRAFNTADGRKMLADLAKKNGLDLDGTPIITNVSDIDNLFQKGYITKQTRAQNAEGRYAICPVIKDPTGGGIAADQFLIITVKADGKPLEPFFLVDFLSLQHTGNWPR